MGSCGWLVWRKDIRSFMLLCNVYMIREASYTSSEVFQRQQFPLVHGFVLLLSAFKDSSLFVSLLALRLLSRVRNFIIRRDIHVMSTLE